MATISEALALAFQHHRAGRLQAAEQIYWQVLAVEPNHADALHHLGVIAQQVGKHQIGVEYIERAIALNGTDASLHNNLGEAYRALQRTPEAIACYRRALELKPDLAAAHNNLGTVLTDLGQLDEAIACFRRALELDPAYVSALNNLAVAFKEQGNMEEAVGCFRRVLQLKPDYALAHSNLIYALSYCPGYDAKAIGEESRRWNEQHAEPPAKFIRPHDNDRSLKRRLRIGYVSPNFRLQAESYFTVPLLAAHNHQGFEIFCYADVPCPDEITERLRSCADVWRNTVGWTDEQLAQAIREDRIDILVDLTMHMADNRLLVFARKPAPVQVCWLAYQGTTGLSTIDYRLTDPFVDPPGLDGRYYAEESIYLPDCFWCYDPLTTGPAVNPLPALDNGFLTFGSLNNFCKVNDPVLKLWACVLRTVPRSKFLLLAAEGTHRQRILATMAREGIATERIVFVARQVREQYLEVYRRIDIGLDTFPYNGQTTTLDAFWLGVPVVTLRGQTAVGRAGVSLLTNIGLPELIAETPEQFVSIAAALAGDLPRLSQLRATLRERLLGSPLMDAPRFARNIEVAYRGMWQRWCAR